VHPPLVGGLGIVGRVDELFEVEPRRDVPAIDGEAELTRSQHDHRAILRRSREQLGQHLLARLAWKLLGAAGAEERVADSPRGGSQHDVEGHSEVARRRWRGNPPGDPVVDQDRRLGPGRRLGVRHRQRYAERRAGVLEQLLRGAVRGVRLDGPHRGMRAHERGLCVARELTRDVDGELGQVGAAPGGQDRHTRAIGDRRGGGRDARNVGFIEHDGGNLAGAPDAQRDVEAIGARVGRGAPGEQHDGVLVHAFDVVQVLDERDERNGRLRPRPGDIAQRVPQGRRLDQLGHRRHHLQGAAFEDRG
jgi:hypothetical protein